MRKHLSVFGLWARCSLYKILAVLAVMSVAEYMLFYIIMSKESAIYEAIGTFSRPENLIDRSGVFLCFAVAFLVITALITVYGCQFSSKTGYTFSMNPNAASHVLVSGIAILLDSLITFSRKTVDRFQHLIKPTSMSETTLYLLVP